MTKTYIIAEAGVNHNGSLALAKELVLVAKDAGADFVAPYINRLDNIVSDGVHVVEEIVNIFKRYDIKTKVLAASFKNVEQVHKAALVGSHAVTINPELFDKLIYHPLTYYAIDDFSKDWESVYGEAKVLDLLK